MAKKNKNASKAIIRNSTLLIVAYTVLYITFDVTGKFGFNQAIYVYALLPLLLFSIYLGYGVMAGYVNDRTDRISIYLSSIILGLVFFCVIGVIFYILDIFFIYQRY
ncbi:MAG: hypothetical protein V4611_04405 [Patescibacteria group bacterium]